ncbi:cytochrome C oxidase subunit II [Bacillus spongiae]|uniref:Cytochrome C oxidase subunit II n=1 Tax=Bacillus spongiae TaxID=2683610 RepID=A0ABU8HI10_9BACI
MKRYLATMASLMILILVLSACGTTSDEGSASSDQEKSQQLTVIGSNWEFDQETYTIPANVDVTFNYKDDEGVHGVKLRPYDDKDNIIAEVMDGESATINLEPGTYEIRCLTFCGDGGHKEMRSKLVVE